jgi:type IV secretion system protein VirB9
MYRLPILFLLFSLITSAQSKRDDPNAPAKVQRKRVPGIKPQPSDFQRAEKMLRTQPPPVLHGEIFGQLPEDRGLILTPSALQAVRMQADWRNGEGIPTEGRNGAIVYTFGEGMPNIACAVRQVTVVELRPGEKLNPETGWAIGDGKEWEVDVHTIAHGAETQPLITLKPKYAGSDTTFVVFTDQRVYYTRLMSTADAYITHVAFRYPQADAVDQIAKLESQRKESEAKSKAAEQLAAADTLSNLKHTNYAIKASKHAGYMKPSLVGDDGAHTIIQLPESARHRNMPALQVSDSSGKDIPNVYTDPKTLRYTVAGLFEKAELVSGTGRKQLKVTITNKDLEDGSNR